MKTIFKKIGKVIDFLGKNLSRIKTIGQVLLIVFFIMSLGGNSCQRNKVVELANKFAEADFMNSILRKDNTQKDSLLVINKIEKDSLNKVIKGLNDNAEVLEYNAEIDRANLRELKDSLMNIPSDSSYKFLQTQAYNFPGRLIYPFNEPQVKNIHLDYLENKGLWVLNENLMNQVDNCKTTLAVKDDIVIKYGEQAIILMSKAGNYEEMIENEQAKNELLTDEVKKEKKKKGFWKICTAIAGGLAVLIAL